MTVAPSIRALFTETNKRCPNRSKASDGTVGDARHRAKKSDHNEDENGIVHAGDLTHDPKNGCDAYAFAEQLRVRKDPRVAYVISNGRIFSSYQVGQTPAWTWRPYTGSNRHEKHTHVSILHNDKARNDLSAWWVPPTIKEASVALNKPAVAVRVTPTGSGYWVFAADGTVYAYGDATYLGGANTDAPGVKIVDADSAPQGQGYVQVADDGAIFAYGSVSYHGAPN